MKIKKCLGSEVPTPSEGNGYFYIDQETNNLILKKYDETVTYTLTDSGQYKGIPANVVTLIKLLESDDTFECYGKVLIKYSNDLDSILLQTARYFKTSDGHIYENVDDVIHTFDPDNINRYVIAYYKVEEGSIWSGIWNEYNESGDELLTSNKIEHIIFYGFNFNTEQNFIWKTDFIRLWWPVSINIIYKL